MLLRSDFLISPGKWWTSCTLGEGNERSQGGGGWCEGPLGCQQQWGDPGQAGPSPSVLGAWELTTGDTGAGEAGPTLGLGFH